VELPRRIEYESVGKVSSVVAAVSSNKKQCLLFNNINQMFIIYKAIIYKTHMQNNNNLKLTKTIKFSSYKNHGKL